jgi:hypothetical protein
MKQSGAPLLSGKFVSFTPWRPLPCWKYFLDVKARAAIGSKIAPVTCRR